MSQNSDAGGDSNNARLDAMLAKSGWSSSVKEKIRQLILLSKQNGYVTVQNINEFIPDSETDPDEAEHGVRPLLVRC